MGDVGRASNGDVAQAPSLLGCRGEGRLPKGGVRGAGGGGKTGSCRLHRQACRAASVSERRRQGSSPKGEDRAAGFVEPGGAKPCPAE